MALVSSIQKDVRPMLDAIDNLRRLGLEQENIPLPTIVVIGDQSSGKSSLLESLAGIPLPRGTGIVTRVPLILRLMSSQNGEEESATIEYDPPAQARVSRPVAMEGVEEAIKEATGVLTEKPTGVVNAPITLTVRKEGLPDLTLVDLPGITRVPVGGQPKDIESIITDMIRGFIEKPETIILNVISAEADFATCGSIKLSQDVDESGERTLAAVTKVDRAPRGLKEKVEQNAVGLRLGYVLVRNRTDEESSLEEAREAEERMFSTSDELKDLEERMRGIPAMARVLCEIQAQRLAKAIPAIQNKISKLLLLRQSELDRMPLMVSSSQEASILVSRFLQRRREMMKEIMAGKYGNFPSNNSMHFAARLHEMFETFSDGLFEKTDDMLREEYFTKCKEVLQESAGVTLSNLLDHSSAALLICQHINDISAEFQELVTQVMKFASKAALVVVAQTCKGYPTLMQLVLKASQSVLAEAKNDAMAFTKRCLQKEVKILYTSSSLYIETVDRVRVAAKSAQDKAEAQAQAEAHAQNSGYSYHPTQAHGKTNAQAGRVKATAVAGRMIDVSKLMHKGDPAQELQIYIFAYSQVVTQRLVDMVAMEIRLLLEEALVDRTDEEATREIYKRDVEVVMGMNPNDLHRRKSLADSVERLKAASELLDEAVGGRSLLDSGMELPALNAKEDSEC